jgi:nucleotide-binding universal stress UspA family protein
MSYGAVQQYFENVENQAKSWFKKVNAIAKNESIYEVKTDILTAATSIIDALIKYAFNTSIDIIVIGTRGRTGIKRLLLGSVAQG